MAAIVTLIVGLIIGYLGQRTQFCTISGIRDFILVKNTYRLRGLLGIILGGAIGYTIFKLMGGNVPNFPLGLDIPSLGLLVATVVGGLGLGFWSVMSEGCPFRQHVMAAEGRMGSMFYLLGFYVGIIYFFTITVKWLNLLVTAVK
jgi:uncharacterized membrane protein YedE/YeeE